MQLGLDTGTVWKQWAAAHGYPDNQIEILMSALPMVSTTYLKRSADWITALGCGRQCGQTAVPLCAFAVSHR